MGPFEIRFKKIVAKDLKGLPQAHVKAILEHVSLLSDDPRHRGCEKLSGFDRYRVRHGPYRIIYEIRDRDLVVIVVKIGHRSHVYRQP